MTPYPPRSRVRQRTRTDEEILAEFSSDQKAMEEEGDINEVEVVEECLKKPSHSK